jgi:nucleoside-diphosphate-sugar epimerase
MRTALIGHTGFVGSNLLRQTSFTQQFNSKTIGSIAGHAFDQVVCCGAPAEKWKANQNPIADWENLERLMTCLERVTTRQVILISTIDVFDAPVGVDEGSPIDPLRVCAYGKHRGLLEKFITARFDSLVVRLPGLFGPGLKKNVIFDFLNNNHVERIHSEARYQFYDLNNIWADIQRALHAKLRLIHLATEPVSVAEVASQGFGRRFDNKTANTPAVYDFRTKYDGLYGSSGGYLYRKQAVLDAIREFVTRTQGEKRCA